MKRAAATYKKQEHLDGHTQCRLVANNYNTTAWIPTAFAVKGKKLKLTDSNDPARVWTVDEVFQAQPDAR